MKQASTDRFFTMAFSQRVKVKEIDLTGNEDDCNAVVQLMEEGKRLTIKLENGKEVSMAVPRGLSYTEIPALRVDGTFFKTEDGHIWRKHGQEIKGGGFYLRCFLRRLTKRMTEQNVEQCTGNITSFNKVCPLSQ